MGPLSLFRISIIERLAKLEAPREGNPLWERAELMLVFHLPHRELGTRAAAGFVGWVDEVWEFFAGLSDDQQKEFQQWLDSEQAAVGDRRVEAV